MVIAIEGKGVWKWSRRDGKGKGGTGNGDGGTERGERELAPPSEIPRSASAQRLTTQWWLMVAKRGGGGEAFAADGTLQGAVFQCFIALVECFTSRDRQLHS